MLVNKMALSEKTKASKRAWYAKNKDKVLASKKAYRERNKEKIREHDRVYYALNKEKWDAYAERARQKKVHLLPTRLAWRDANREKVYKSNRAWMRRNMDAVRSYAANRRARICMATPKWITEDDLFFFREAHHLALLREKATGIKWHVDHVIPLAGKNVCGLHVPNNIQVIPAIQNVKKHNYFEVGE